MPHGIKLDLDTSRIMDAPLPGGPEQAQMMQESANEAEVSDVSGVEKRAFRLGKREAKEAVQENDYQKGDSFDQMVSGILENAGLVSDDVDQSVTNNIRQAFLRGWDSIQGEGPEEEQPAKTTREEKSRLVEQGAAYPVGGGQPGNDVFI